MTAKISRTENNLNQIGYTGWTRMVEAIRMHSWPTVTRRHTVEDGPCVTLLMNMSNLRAKSHTALSFPMELTGTGRTVTTSL